MHTLAIKPDCAELATLARGGRLPLRAGCLGLERDASPGYRVERSAAILPVYGMLGVGWMAEFMGTPTIRLARTIAAADQDPAVSAIVLELDSPGGETSNLHQAVDAIRACTKPVVAYVSDAAYSAGYWLASQCRWIGGSRTHGVGAIGTINLVVDTSKADEKLGLRAFALCDPETKADFFPGLPIDEAMLERGRTHARAVTALFRADVARGRNVPEAKVVAWSAVGSNAGDFVGALAVAAGLTDEVCALDRAIDKALELAAMPLAAMPRAATPLAAVPAATDRTTTAATAPSRLERLIRRRTMKEAAMATSAKSAAQVDAMTPEEMEKEDPEQYAALESHFKAKFGVEEKDQPKAEPEAKAPATSGATVEAVTVKQLKALLPEGTPDREKIIVASLEANDTLAAAQSRIIAAQGKMLAELSAKVSAAPARPARPAGVGTGQAPVVDNKADGPTDFMAALSAHMAQHKCDASTARRAVIAAHPELYQAYLKAQKAAARDQ